MTSFDSKDTLSRRLLLYSCCHCSVLFASESKIIDHNFGNDNAESITKALFEMPPLSLMLISPSLSI